MGASAPVVFTCLILTLLGFINKKEEMPMRDIKKQKERKRDTKGKRLFKELLIKMMGEKPIEKEV